MKSLNLNRGILQVALLLLLATLGITNAWAGTTTKKYYYYATMNVSSTGNGYVYASNVSATQEQAISTSSSCGPIQDSNTSYSEPPANGQVTFYLSAKPQDDSYKFDGWSESATRPSSFLSNSETYEYTVFVPKATKTGSNPGGTANATATESNATGDKTEHYPNTTTKNLYAYFSEKKFVNITFIGTETGAYKYTIDGVTNTVSNAGASANNVGEVILSDPTPASGYLFVGWYQINTDGTILDISNDLSKSVSFSESGDVSIGARFISTSTPKFRNVTTNTEYFGLKAALLTASSGHTIVPVSDETVVDGSDLMPFDNGTYTIKAGTTLLIPYSSANTVQTAPVKINTTASATAISPYRKLILSDGVNIDCDGTICVGGQADAGNGGNPSGYVTGACGVIDMSKGGHIEMNNKSVLYCWGFIKGQDMDQGNNTVGAGTITANSGSVIWEDFSVGDWRGGTFTGTIAMGSSRFFPFQSYFIQNIEIPVTYKYGSTLKNFFTFNMSSSAQETSFDVIGSGAALFKLTDAQSLVRKWYDPTTDLMCYELSGTAIIDHIELNVSGYDVNSEDFDLPINSNMHIILTRCNLTLNKPMLIQPGAVVEIKEDANVTIATKIYLYDKDQWGPWISGKYYRSYGDAYPILTSHKNRGNGSSNADLDDATFLVDGTLTISSGAGLYSSTGGANIMGNGGGKIVFSSSLPSATSVKWYKGTKTSGDGEVGTTAMKAANLCNEDGSYTKSIASTTFHNVNGRWFAASAKDEKADHTYDFTYISSGEVSGTGGTSSTTDAVYSNDKTGMEARMKWANVTEDACADWWHGQGDQAGWFYNWTMNSAWHQFQSTETEGLYSGSNNTLYTKSDCTWEELGSTDINCLYTIDGKKKALVAGHFIELEPNSDDAAFHEAADPTKYYICFEGCNWHAATKYEGEKKAYVVDETTFIWYEERWMAVEREEPFFYTKDETNVTIYYEYIGSEWVLAQPYVEVTDATETRQLLRFNEAITVASAKKNVTIKLLRDLVNITTPMTFTAQNTTCTLDLNGHVAELQVTGSGTTAIYMLTLNCAGTTFTITDNTADKKGELKLITSFTTENNTKRWGGIYLQNGALVMANGKLHVENPVPYTKSTKVGYIEAILVASGKTLTVNGGTIEAKSAYNPYGIEAASGTPTININGGTIETIATTNDSPYGISGYGTINIKGGEVRAIASGSSSSRGVSVSAGSSYQGTVNVTGGTIYSEATSSAQGIYCGGTAVVTGDYNATTPNNTPKNRYYAKANISGGTITAVCRTSTSSYGVLSYGTTTISGGTITSTVQKSNQNTAYGVCASGGTTTIQNGANITANAPTKAYGVTATGANGDSNRGWPHIGVVNITGGTITANTTNTTTAYGLLVTGATWTINKTNDYKVFNGDYAAAGTATVTGGTFNANAKTTLARGIAVGATKTLNDASATPKCTINGGYYKMTGTGDVLGCNASALPADFHINGGYYSHDGNLATYAASPKHVLTLAAGDANRPPYYYKVAEAYQVTFKTEDGTANIIDPIYQEVNTKPVCSTEPTKASTSTNSFTFDGWATAANGDKVYEKNGLPNVTSAGATYYAHFATTTLKYRVHFDAATNGGDCATENIYVDPGTAVGSLPTATKYGYTFSGWFTAASGGTKLEATTVINANADYYAQFTVNSHTLTWDLASGAVGTAGKIGSTTWPAKNATGTQSRSVAYGTVLTTIPVVTKAGYVFNRWDPVPTSSMPDNDVTYTALWNPATNTKYYVKHYQQNIDDDNYTLVETDELTGTTDATVTPDRKSYDGFLTPTPQQLTIGAAGTTELAYYYDRVVYTIYWNASANGGACATASTDVRHGANIALPAATKAGHILEGWYTKAEGGNKISEGATILQNYGTLYAQFVPTYTIIWNDENGNELSREEKLIGESLTPPDYSKEDTQEWDYTFHGWNDGTTTYAANAIPAVSGVATYTADVTKVKNNYTLTIGVVEAGYGSVNETSVTVPYGTSVSTSGNVLTIGTTTVTATPTASNAQYTYTFSTWQNVPTSVTGNVDNIQAVFTRTLNTVTVTWKNGGDIIETDEGVVIGATPSFDGETPTKATDENFGYTFDGWSTTDGGEKVDPLPAVSGNTIYYAHYSTTPTVASVTVGGSTTYYTDFAEAWDATNSATGAVTLKLLQDVSGIATSMAYTNAQNCTLDLNNHTIAGTVTKLIDVNASGKTFTIDDSSTAKSGKISLSRSTNGRIYSLYITAGTVNLKQGTIYCKNTNTGSSAGATAVYVTKSQKFTMDDGSVESESRISSFAIYASEAGTTTITINGGLVKGHTNYGKTAIGIYTKAKGLTVNGGRIIGHAWTDTSYGIYLYGGSGTLNGGTIEATNDTTSSKGTTTTYGINVVYVNGTYKGVLTIPSTSKVNVLAKARTTTSYAIVVGGSSTGSTIAGGTFTAKTKTGKTAYAVNSSGNITISGGTFIANSATTNAYGLYSPRGTITVSGNPTFNVTSGTSTAYGALAYGTIGKKGTGKYSGTIKINGGTFNVTSTSTDAYGALAGLASRDLRSCSATNDTVPGLHYMPGILEITNGTFNVKAKTTAAYGVHVAAAKNESGDVGTTTRIPLGTITGGKFKMESMGDANATAYAMTTTTTAARLVVQGGYYSTKAISATSNIEDKYTAPTKDCNYHVLPLTDEDPYKYEVAEAYMITFKNGDDVLQSTAVKKGTTPAYSGEEPTKAADAQYTYTFTGWSPALATVTEAATYTATFTQTVNKYSITWVDGNGATLKTEKLEYGATPSYTGAAPTKAEDASYTYSFTGWLPEIVAVTGEATYTAQFNSTPKTDIGPVLDIVDWTTSNLTINATAFPSAGWPYVINGVTYDKTDRADDRTLSIPYSGSADDNLSIEVRKKTVTGDIYSCHTYKIPHVYSEDEASLFGTDESSVVYVNSGSLHINAATEVDAIYVGSQAELVVNSPLTVNTLVLRTKEFEAASLEKNSTVYIKGHAYYTRIVSDMAYHQFALPRGVSSTDDVFLSNHAACPYGTTWLLKSYDESSRAKNGTGANVQNWKELKDKDPITASVGYELYSGSAYYREFYFPVEIPDETADKVTVSCTKPEGKTTEWYTANSGWNALCSPLLGKYVQDFGAHPEDGLKVSELTSDGHYWQHPSTVIYPAVPFYYQAPETGYLDFSGDKMTILKAPRRAWYTDIPTQWLQLAISNLKGDKLDETSIYAHPEKFAPEYEIGYDVAKQSLTGGKALIYSELPCGKLAFVAVPDSLAEQRIPLTIYAAAQEEYVFSLAENNYLGRLQHVLLHDTQNGLVIDLLERDYATEINAGTNAGRFYIQCVFAAEAPAVTTGVNSVESNDDAPQKIMYKNKVYIIYQGRVYDMTGRQCELK